jgi:hypothetical protein
MALAADAAGQLVAPSELHRRLVEKSASRKAQIAQLRRFFASPEAKKALAAARMEPRKVEEAIAVLDAGELAKLSSRAAKTESDFAAGALSNQELTYIVIALATAVIILVIVAA